MLIASWTTLAIPLLTASENSRLALFIDSGDPYLSIITTDRQREFLHALEVRCRKSSVSLDIIHYYFHDGTLHFSGNSTAIPTGKETLGYFIWSYRNDHMAQPLLDMLRKYKKPISVLDEITVTPASPPIATTQRPAIEVARYLLSMGHRRIVYVSP